MLLVNHHAHTTFSDGRDSAETMVRRAIELGLDGYGFSDHAPLPISDFGNMPMERLAEYDREVGRLRQKYAGRIRVYKSLEVDYVPGLIDVNSDYILAAGLDYTVGAVHYIDELDGRPWSFQRP